MIAAPTLRPGLAGGVSREIGVPSLALGLGLLLFFVATRLGNAPIIPIYAPLIDMAIVVGLLVVAAVAAMDVTVRRDGRSLPIVAVAIAAAAMWLPHMLSFPLALPLLVQAAHVQASAVVLDVVQIAIPATLVAAFLQPAAAVSNPWVALRNTALLATGFGVVCAGSALVVAPLLPPLTDGLRFTPAHTALQVASLAPTVVAILVFLRGHRLDRRMELSLVATLILLSFGELTSISDQALFDGRWYMANLFRFLPVVALMAGQLTLYADTLVVERRRDRHLDLLHRITGELVGGLDIGMVLDEVVASATDLLTGLRGVSGATAVLLRVEDGLATPVAQHVAAGPDAEPFRVDASSSLVEALANGRAVEARVDDGAAGMKDPLAAPGASWLAYAPVRVRGAVVGAVGAATLSQPARDAAVLPLLQGIADLAGIAIRNAQDYRTSADRSLDLLTSLPNRHEFQRLLAAREGEVISVLAIDVDDLQSVNNEYGHAAGDQVLQTISRILTQTVRGRDVVARVGGDEFAALLHGAGPSEAAAVAQRILDTLQGVEMPFGSKGVFIGCATGGPGIDPHDVVGWADEALYRARKFGRGRIESFGQSPAVPVGRASDWSVVLQGMLQEGGLRAVYQPIVDLSTGELHGFEALARPVNAPSHASVEALFAAALRMGLGVDLDWFCRRAAVDGARELPEATPIFVNVTMAGLLDPLHGVDQTLMLLDWFGRKPTEVVLELSEREAVTDKERLSQVLADYREGGVRFAMDDVGEGHSTLELLTASSPEYVKVARSLVTSAATSPEARAVIESLTTFAARTGALVIAEGLETLEDVQAMADLGVALGQGYVLGRPEAAAVSVQSMPAVLPRATRTAKPWERWVEQRRSRDDMPEPAGPDPETLLDSVKAARLEVAGALAGAASQEEGLAVGLEIVGRAFGAQVAEAWMGSGLRLSRLAAWTSDQARFDSVLMASADARPSPGEGLQGRVWNSGEPIVASRLGPADVPAHRLAAAAGLVSGIGFPIIQGTSVTGAICVLAEEPRGSDLELAAVMLDIGRQVGEFLSHREALAEGQVLLHQLEERGRQLEVANRVKSQFLKSVSHELRTPVSVVLAYTDLLQSPESLDPAELKAGLSEISAAGHRLAHLIDDMIQYSYLRAGEVAPRAEPIDTGRLVIEVVDSLEVAARAKSLRLKTRLPEQPVMAKADDEHVRHVLSELVANALKFTTHGGVEVAVERQGEDVLVSVEDTGAGIPASTLEWIFEDFRAVDESNNRRPGGAGLGLAIVRSLVELQGGTIGVNSTEGEGSTFWFTLPGAG